MLKLTLKR